MRWNHALLILASGALPFGCSLIAPFDRDKIGESGGGGEAGSSAMGGASSSGSVGMTTSTTGGMSSTGGTMTTSATTGQGGMMTTSSASTGGSMTTSGQGGMMTTSTSVSTGEGGMMTTSSTSSGGAICGNGMVEPGEECDDGNAIEGDGCYNCLLDCGCEGCQAGMLCEGCGPSAGSVTYKDPASKHCYLYGGTEEAWPVARSECSAWGGDLAGFSTVIELNMIKDTGILKSLAGGAPSARCWVGGNDQAAEGQYVWANGELWNDPPVGLSWASAQPDGGANQNCVYIDGQYMMRDRECSIFASFVCERGP